MSILIGLFLFGLLLCILGHHSESLREEKRLKKERELLLTLETDRSGIEEYYGKILGLASLDRFLRKSEIRVIQKQIKELASIRKLGASKVGLPEHPNTDYHW